MSGTGASPVLSRSAAVSPCPSLRLPSSCLNSVKHTKEKTAAPREVVTPPESSSSSPSSEANHLRRRSKGVTDVASRLFSHNRRPAGDDENCAVLSAKKNATTVVPTSAPKEAPTASEIVPPSRYLGHTKTSPVCRSVVLREESLGSAELSEMCWRNYSCSKPREDQESLLQRTVSRSGRQHQLWVREESADGRLCRVVTGTVPILSDGRVIVCSSSRKAEWILPKGGAETDETMEESALRETYEEAGVLGVLGPKLAEVQYETRKGKKRRLEREALSTSSSAFESDTSTATCSHVRMTLFPLYVTEVRDEWPESGRARKALCMDAAIEAMKSRPEFRKALLEVKRRALHLRLHLAPEPKKRYGHTTTN